MEDKNFPQIPRKNRKGKKDRKCKKSRNIQNIIVNPRICYCPVCLESQGFYIACGKNLESIKEKEEFSGREGNDYDPNDEVIGDSFWTN